MIEKNEEYERNKENWVINEDLAKTLNKELENLYDSELDQKTKDTQEKNKTSILKVVNCLIKYAKSVEYSGDYVLLKASQFNSGFLKPDFTRTKIIFPTVSSNKVVSFGDKVSSISGIGTERNDFFYLFYSRNEENSASLEIDKICRELIREFV